MVAKKKSKPKNPYERLADILKTGRRVENFVLHVDPDNFIVSKIAKNKETGKEYITRNWYCSSPDRAVRIVLVESTRDHFQDLQEVLRIQHQLVEEFDELFKLKKQ